MNFMHKKLRQSNKTTPRIAFDQKLITAIIKDCFFAAISFHLISVFV
jgi:hypothetical protein